MSNTKNFAPFTKCISKTNNIKIDDAQEIGLAIPMHKLIQCSGECLKTSLRL